MLSKIKEQLYQELQLSNLDNNEKTIIRLILQSKSFNMEMFSRNKHIRFEFGGVDIRIDPEGDTTLISTRNGPFNHIVMNKILYDTIFRIIYNISLSYNLDKLKKEIKKGIR